MGGLVNVKGMFIDYDLMIDDDLYLNWSNVKTRKMISLLFIIYICLKQNYIKQYKSL